MAISIPAELRPVPAGRQRVSIDNNPRLQSPYIFLQAAGSDGRDETSPGIQLRWVFQRRLGDNHLPKGTLSGPAGPYPSTLGFNRDKDFVHIYKAPYSEEFFAVQVSFERITGGVVESGDERTWRFSGNFPIEGEHATTDVILRFTDLAHYDFIRSAVNPLTNSLEFLRRYEGRVELEAVGKHMLRVCILFVSNPQQTGPEGPYARGESVSARDRLDAEDLYLSCRHEIRPTTKGEQLCFTCEDIRYVRFQYRKSAPVAARLQTYEDYILGVFRSGDIWRHIGAFSLSEDDAVVKARLVNIPHDDVDGRWPKFNEADLGTGQFTVRVSNYVDRWQQPNDGMKAGVQRYLSLSRFDPQANDVLMDTTTQPNEAAMEVSHLDLLNMVAQDYHVARMLGLGHIDNDVDTRKTPMVYLMEYVTTARLEFLEPGQFVTHYYMTPPVIWTDYRLPPAPTLDPVRYGLYLETAEGETRLLSDADGYIRFEPSRYVNLDRESYEFEGPLPTFWSGAPNYCLCTATIPALYGVEYRKKGESTWRVPEISHDPEYMDKAGVPETVPTPEVDENPVFTHRETEEGIHQYALYSINWFSRVSSLSNVVETDDTVFPILKSLKPPANLAVQFIQEESPLVLTTAAEQSRLANLSGPEKTLVRVTFDWDQVHNIEYQFADMAEFFFREKLPENIQGSISTAAASIVDLPGNRVRVATAPLTIESEGTPEVRQPILPPAEKSRFVGGNFVYEDRAFTIDDIQFPDPTGANPTFILNKIRESASLETDEPDDFIVQESWVGPETPDKPFMAVENLNQVSNWDSQLARMVYIEPFHEAFRVEIAGSAANDRAYTLTDVTLAGAQTRLTVAEDIASENPAFGDLVYRRKARVTQSDTGLSRFTVAGDLQSGAGGLAVGTAVDVFGAPENAGAYTVTSVGLSGGETVVGVNPAPPASIASGYLGYDKHVAVANVDRANRHVFVNGDLRDELFLPRIETRTEPDGTVSEFVIGGISATAIITEFEDVDGSGNTITGSHTGVFEVVFGGFQLADHVDPSVDWYRGTVRIMEDAALFPPTGAPNYRPPEHNVLNIWELDRSAANLRLVVFDPTFDAASGFDPKTDYMPIERGLNVDVNVHPGYRIYLRADTTGGNKFDETTILPATGAGSKSTLMAARSADTARANCFSSITTPVVLLAQEIREPVAPGEPSGPRFATRPDFYGKATYTFDIDVDNPFALIFCRANDRAILDALYKQDTVRQILEDLANLDSPDADFVNDLWRDLANSVTDDDDLFLQYIPGGYRFPKPDNAEYVLPNQDSTVIVKPFAGGNTPPGQIIAAVRTAVEGAFVPLTEQPVIFQYLNTGTVTSSRPSVIRDSNGEILLPADPGYDPWPMGVTLPGSNKVRFTDYNLDGASTNFYFYFAVELSNRMRVSDRSPVAGPITLVNSFPPEAPEIRHLRVRTANPVMDLPAAVVFELNRYLEADNIARFRTYRTTDQTKAQNVRSMDLVKTVEANDDVLDDFEGMDFPPYGEALYYRIEALRRFLNEDGEIEYAPSKPSPVREVRLVDDQVPPALEIAFLNDVPLPGPPVQLPNVRLTWRRAAWNPRYHVYKLNRFGNWVKIHTFASNDSIVTLDLAATDLGTNILDKESAAGQTYYHRFKVVTENSCGLLSQEEKPLTI